MPKPDTKVAAGGIASMLTIVVVWILSTFGVDMPAGVAAALTGLISLVVAYFKKDPDRAPVPDPPGDAA